MLLPATEGGRREETPGGGAGTKSSPPDPPELAAPPPDLPPGRPPPRVRASASCATNSLGLLHLRERIPLSSRGLCDAFRTQPRAQQRQTRGNLHRVLGKPAREKTEAEDTRGRRTRKQESTGGGREERGRSEGGERGFVRQVQVTLEEALSRRPWERRPWERPPAGGSTRKRVHPWWWPQRSEPCLRTQWLGARY